MHVGVAAFKDLNSSKSILNTFGELSVNIGPMISFNTNRPKVETDMGIRVTFAVNELKVDSTNVQFWYLYSDLNALASIY